MCYFGRNNPFLIYASCVILPTGHWGKPYYSKPAAEERVHLTALWVTSNTSKIETSLGGSRYVKFDHMIQSWCLFYRGDSQPAIEECPILPTGHWGTAAVWGDRSHHIENHVWGPWYVISGKIILSWYRHHMWYSKPTSEEHPITPNRPLRNGCIWRHYGALRCVIFDHMIQPRWLFCWGNSQPASEERLLLPTGHWGMAAFVSNMWGLEHIKNWKPCLGVLMCHLETNNRLLIYALCVILPMGQ